MQIANYKIYQAGSDASDFRFMRWDFAKEHGFDFTKYTDVWNSSTGLGDNPYKTLGYLFFVFNQEIPEGFAGHSMSVSDIVFLGGKYYYCNDIGFIDITDTIKEV